MAALASHVPTPEETRQQAVIMVGAATVASLFVPGPEDIVLAGVAGRAVMTSRVGKVFSRIFSKESTRTASKFEDVTQGRSVTNRLTDVTPTQFSRNLEAGGFTKTMSKDGKVTILTKDNVRYTIRSQSDSTGGPTAEVLIDGKVVQKIRFEKE